MFLSSVQRSFSFWFLKMTWDSSHRWDSRPKTRNPKDVTWDPRLNSKVGPGPETRNPKRGTQGPRPGTLEVVFQQIFSVFFETWRLWMNSCTWCVCVYFVCFSLPYHKAYTLLIFYYLKKLLFPCFCKNFHHAAIMKSLNLWQNQW